MPWAVEWTARAVRDLARLDRQIARRIVVRLESAAEDPDRYFDRLTGSIAYKLRIGEYRLLAELVYSRRLIMVERVGHRSQIYQRLG